MPDAPDCGDPGCDTCHPPRRRCASCGALHADPDVPFCSLECAVAGGDEAAEAADARHR